MYKESQYTGYLKDLRVMVLRIGITVGLVTTLCMTFSISFFDFDGYKIPLLYPGPLNNLATQIIHIMKENLLPKNVNLIQVTPQGAFLTQIYVAALIGITLAVPITIRELAAFVRPALNKKNYNTCHRTFCNRLLILILFCYTKHTQFFVQIWRVNWR
jgi:sec-independent protein translocase protein TatC